MHLLVRVRIELLSGENWYQPSPHSSYHARGE